MERSDLGRSLLIAAGIVLGLAGFARAQETVVSASMYGSCRARSAAQRQPASSTAIVRDFAAPIELGAGLGVRVGQRVSVTVLPTAGVTDASPRYGLTIGMSTEMFRR